MLPAAYTWTKRGSGQQFKVPSRWGKQGGINVLGTLSLYEQQEQLEYRLLNAQCCRAEVVAYLTTLAQTCKPDQLTVVVLDNATFHKGGEMNEKRAQWEAKGLYLRYLPPYCPQLNAIETTWRKLKGFLMPRRCYDRRKSPRDDTLAQLRDALLTALGLLNALQR